MWLLFCIVLFGIIFYFDYNSSSNNGKDKKDKD